MNIKLVDRGTEAEMLMIGRLDASTANDAQEILVDACKKYDKVILNFAELEYISSAGLRILKILHMDMTKKGGKLVLKNVNTFVMEVFEMTGFAGILSFE